MESDYKVKLEIFEGPLDLLLYLIKRDELDIYEISLERITRQYLEYLQAFKQLNIDVAGEFVSYSGSFVLMIMFGLGIVNSVWVHRKAAAI